MPYAKHNVDAHGFYRTNGSDPVAAARQHRQLWPSCPFVAPSIDRGKPAPAGDAAAAHTMRIAALQPGGVVRDDGEMKSNQGEIDLAATEAETEKKKKK